MYQITLCYSYSTWKNKWFYFGLDRIKFHRNIINVKKWKILKFKPINLFLMGHDEAFLYLSFQHLNGACVCLLSFYFFCVFKVCVAILYLFIVRYVTQFSFFFFLFYIENIEHTGKLIYTTGLWLSNCKHRMCHIVCSIHHDCT